MDYKPFIDTYVKDVCYSNVYTKEGDKESKLVFRARIIIPYEANLSNKQLKVNKNRLKSFTNVYLNKYGKTKNNIEFEITIRNKATKHENDSHSVNIAIEVLMLKSYKTIYKYIKTILDYYLVSYDEIKLVNEFDYIISQLGRLKE
jgi:hypothetical protein